MDIKIKSATLDDVAKIAKIEQSCFSTPWSKSSIKESLKNENSHFYLAFADGEAAGYIGVQIFSGEGYITNVAVLPEFRRQGIAKALIETALSNKMEFLTLEVRESNAAAIALYKSLGFEKVGTRPNFYRSPEENAILMTKYM